MLFKSMEHIKATDKGYHGRKNFNNRQMFYVTVLLCLTNQVCDVLK